MKIHTPKFASAIVALAPSLAISLVVAMTPASARAADFNLRVHTLVRSPHPYNDMAAFLKADLEKKSNGRIAVKIFDSGQLGQDPAVIGEVGLGTIDLMVSTSSNAAKQIPELSIFNMPYLFAGIDDALAKIGPGTPVHTHFEKVYAKRVSGVKLLALGASGTRNLSTASVAVNSIDDLKGLKMRTPQSPMDAKTWGALGMLPVTVAWGELYAAIQTGVAQALESSLPGYAGSKLYEVAPNLALTGHTVQINHISISQRTWQKLPDELKKLVETSAIEANRLGVEKAKEYDGSLVEKLQKEHKVKVTMPDKAAFIERLKPIQTDLAKELDLVEEFALLKK